MEKQIQSWLASQKNTAKAQAAIRMASYLNRAEDTLEGIVSTKCVHSSQAWCGANVGVEGIETGLASWLGPELRKTFAELGAEPLRGEPCIVLYVRDSFTGAMGLGQIRSYFRLCVDEQGLIEELHAVSFQPAPRECALSGVFPGLSAEQLQAERVRMGELLQRSDELTLELHIREDQAAQMSALTAVVTEVADRLLLPAPGVFLFDSSNASDLRKDYSIHPSIALFRGNDRVVILEGHTDPKAIEHELKKFLYPMDDPTEMAWIELARNGPPKLEDYFASDLSQDEQVIRKIKGTHRSTMVREHQAAGTLESIPKAWLEHSLSEQLRSVLGRENPSFRGGEDLPDLEAGEVELARISLQSVHGEVTSLRARDLENGQAQLRMVDEDETEFTLPLLRINRPLTSEEVGGLFRDVFPSATSTECRFTMSSHFYARLEEDRRRLGIGTDGEQATQS